MASSKIKVAVIGAGAAGLCAARHLNADPDRFEFDIFEQQDHVGGTWKYTDYVGRDEYGLPVHSSMYKNLRTNLPKEVMAFPDLPFLSVGEKSFLHHTEVQQYLEDYARHFGVDKLVKFLKRIENVRPLKRDEDETEWEVVYSDVVTQEKETAVYNAVMVCNGHYSVPHTPEIEGLDGFEGILIHSHDYRDPARLRDLKVVVLGAGASGIDIAIEICSVAKEVMLSHNKPTKKCPLPENLTEQSGIETVGKNSVTFFGGKSYECDAIVLCTGYLYSYPFLDASCNVEIDICKVSPLYLHLFVIHSPTLAIWAVPKMILPFPIYDNQVRLFLKFLTGEVQLPSPKQMKEATEKDFQRRLDMGYQERHVHLLKGEQQWEYDDEVTRLGDINPIPDAVRNLFRHVHHTRTVDILNYKGTNYKLQNDGFVEVI